MQVTETQTEGLKRSYTIVISAAEIDDKIDGRLQELGSQIKVPGFRPGKVPITVLKQRYGSAVRGEILERAVNDASTQALNERGIRPAAQPKIDIVSADEGKDLEYSMELEVLPEIEPMDFAAMELERVKIVVTEEEVDKALERIAADRKTTKPLDDPRPSESGDVLVLDFQGTVKGEPHPGVVRSARGHIHPSRATGQHGSCRIR